MGDIARRRWLNFLILLVAPLLLALAFGGAQGCGVQDDVADASQTFGPQTAGGFTVALRASTYPPEPRGQARFVITITDKEGEPVTGARVVLDMTMPAMPMPPNRPEAIEQAPGQYTTTVVFTMAGEWDALIAVTTAQGEKISVTFAMETK